METEPTRIRVIDLETGGNGPDDVCKIGCQDHRRSAGGVRRLDDERSALLIKLSRPMSPDTTPLHHILDAHVANSSYWREIVARVLRPEGSVAVTLHDLTAGALRGRAALA